MRVKIRDIVFESPLLTASGTYGYGHEVQNLVKVNEWGGIITKSVTRLPREGNPPPRIEETSSGMLNSIGLANLGVDKYCQEIIPSLNELETQIIINIAGSAIEDYLETMEILESTNGKHVGYEINISCPNVKKGGMEFGVDPKAEMYKLPAAYVGEHAEADARLTLDLWQHFKALLSQEDLWQIFDLEAEVLPLCIQMTWNGVRIDLEKAERLKQNLTRTMGRLGTHWDSDLLKQLPLVVKGQ